MVTFQDRLVAVKFRPSGFDYMRLILAVGVIALHSVEVSYGNDAAMAVWASRIVRPLVAIILPMFFALSGFLVASSLERNKSLISFLGLRIIRLVPALAVEITLSALILGPLFSDRPLGQYFTDPRFFHYFTNILGLIRYQLPGVFSKNPFPNIVNSQLWTIPFELECYAVLSVIASIGMFKSMRGLLVAMVLLQLCVGVFVLTHPQPFQLIPLGRLLIGPFLAGLTLYRCRYLIPWNGFLAAACAIALLVMLRHSKGADYFIYFPVAYLTAYLGLLNPIRTKVVLSGDYSYGMYLYGYPIQQAFAALGGWTHHWWLDMAVCLPLTAGFALFSWHYIEKPAQNLKKPLLALECIALNCAPFYRYTRLVFMGSPRG